jgi:hypothetical protein
MCPTPLGRIQTRTAIIWGPAILGLILTLVTGREDWIVLIGVYLLLGVALDAGVYSWLLRYQPPWMTFILGLAEFGLLYVLAQILELNLSPAEAIIFYWASWVIATASRIAVLPIISLTYIESSGEFRHVAWSLPPDQVPFPVIAAVDMEQGPTVRGASGAAIPIPIERLPSPSGGHQVPGAGERV